MTLVLHQLPPLDRAPSLSPFCTKVETYLRMTGVAYRSVPTLDASSGPKGKLPFIEDDGRRLGDSRLIIEHLKRTRGDALDAHLDARARAVAVGFERMMDEHLYWAIVHSRWLDERFAPRMHEAFFAALPREHWPTAAGHATDAMRSTLATHGIGRHSDGEIAAAGAADLAALADLLGAHEYALGAAPSTLDASAYAFVSGVLDVEMDTALRRYAASRENLVAYCARMRARYYPDLPA